jgi:hypothetical protein
MAFLKFVSTLGGLTIMHKKFKQTWLKVKNESGNNSNVYVLPSQTSSQERKVLQLFLHPFLD